MSLKGTIRDSWDVWRRKVDTALGGSVEDIKASEVTFDGTTSSLSATNVQSAIDEVAGNIPEIPTSYTASAITYDNTNSGLEATDVQSAIDEIEGRIDTLEGLYHFVEKNSVQYTMAENDTYGMMMDAVCASMQSVIDALDENSFIVCWGITIQSLVVLTPRQTPFAKNDVFQIVSSAVTGGNDSYEIWNSIGYSAIGTNSLIYRGKTDDTNSTTFLDVASVSAPAGKKITINYYKYSKG